MAERPVLVATAGHIDHGKTSLVRALTGVDLDTLPEEQARGITIALGFTDGLVGDRHVSFVDVPGHERLVRTMAAGAHGVDAALLIVAADDGVMPQTREHLAILDLLGVTQGSVVLTKVDLVDEDWADLAADDVAELLADTPMAAWPVVRCSAVAGTGLDAVRARLATFEPVARTGSGPFRLPVDRAFVRDGFGTVVTGTAMGAPLADGADVVLWPSGERARVRGMHTHGEGVDASAAGCRTALNLGGVDLDAVPRGVVVAAGELPCPHILDLTYQHVSDEVAAKEALEVRVLLGTSEVLGKLHFAAEPPEVGQRAPAQLRLREPLPCLPGDRLVVRRASPVSTLGGGVVRDPWAARLRAKHAATWTAEMARLEAGDAGVWLERAGPGGLPVAEAASRGVEGVILGDRVVAEAFVERLTAQGLDRLSAFHDAQPLREGALPRELADGALLALSSRAFDALVARWVEQGRAVFHGPRVALPDFAVALGREQVALRDAMVSAVAEAGLVGIVEWKLLEAFPQPDALAVLHTAEGTVHKVSDLGWVSAEATETLRAGLVAWFDTHEEVLTPAGFRDAFDLTRKTAIPWLAWCDGQRWTRRDAEGRQRGEALTA